MNRTQKKTLVLLLGILVGLGILLAVVSAVKRSSAQREAEEAAAQDAASVPGQHHYGRQQLLYADERTGESGVYHLQLPVHRDVQDHL